MNPLSPPAELLTELLIMPDGTIYVHNLTAPMAAALSELNPQDQRMQRRGQQTSTADAASPNSPSLPPLL